MFFTGIFLVFMSVRSANMKQLPLLRWLHCLRAAAGLVAAVVVVVVALPLKQVYCFRAWRYLWNQCRLKSASTTSLDAKTSMPWWRPPFLSSPPLSFLFSLPSFLPFQPFPVSPLLLVAALCLCLLPWKTVPGRMAKWYDSETMVGRQTARERAANWAAVGIGSDSNAERARERPSSWECWWKWRDRWKLCVTVAFCFFYERILDVWFLCLWSLLWNDTAVENSKQLRTYWWVQK